jgi:von Willebrand factor type A domain
MSSNSYKISKDLFLVRYTTEKATASKPIEIPTNHFLVIDCSGSMGSDLPKIREQLKRKLPKLLKEKDTVSIIWFSGKGEFGTLIEAEPVATLKDLKTVENAIDRWLRPIGLTGFTEPLQEAARVVAKVTKARPSSVASLLFLSDGYDNQGSRAKILESIQDAAKLFSATAIVEYGYYADRNMLSAMAEKAGGSLIFSEDFDRYDPSFEAVLQRRPTGAKRVTIKIQGDPIGGFAFTIGDKELLTYAVEAGGVSVPEDIQELWYLNQRKVGEVEEFDGSLPDADAASAVYAAVSLFSVRMKPAIVYPLLGALGDSYLVKQFGGCFGKQKYSEFQELAQKAAFGEGRLQQGYDPRAAPKNDAFTVLDLLQLLASDNGNRVLLEHQAFRYSKISRARVDASSQLTAEEQEEIRILSDELGRTKKAARVTEINKSIAAITANKPEPLKFIAAPAPEGYPISDLVYNEDSPHVSLLVRKSGTVDLSKRTKPDTIPDAFPTFVFRNYAIIKDGLVNISVLPVRMSKNTWREFLQRIGSKEEMIAVLPDSPVLHDSYVDAILHLRPLPVINRKMVQDVSAKRFFELKYELLQLRAEQKVLNSYAKELINKPKSVGFTETYGEEATLWLKDQGFTDYSGFSPKSVVAESTDSYVSKELKVSLKGYSTLPSLKEAKTQIAKKKLNGPSNLMAPTINTVEEFLKSEFYAKSKEAGRSETLEVWLSSQIETTKDRTRSLIRQIAQITFSLIVGQVWFSEFDTLDESSYKIIVGESAIQCEAKMREIEVKI